MKTKKRTDNKKKGSKDMNDAQTNDDNRALINMMDRQIEVHERAIAGFDAEYASITEKKRREAAAISTLKSAKKMLLDGISSTSKSGAAKKPPAAKPAGIKLTDRHRRAVELADGMSFITNKTLVNNLGITMNYGSAILSDLFRTGHLERKDIGRYVRSTKPFAVDDASKP